MARETEARLTLAQARIVLLPARIRILRALAEKRSTVTELARRTGFPKSTVLKHLKVLERHDLVSRSDEDRLWVYYDLTRAGRLVGRLDPLRILVIGALAVAGALLAGAVVAWRWGESMRASQDPWDLPPIGVNPEEPAGFAWAAGLAIAGGLVLIVALSLWWRARLPRKPAGETEAATGTSSSP